MSFLFVLLIFASLAYAVFAVFRTVKFDKGYGGGVHFNGFRAIPGILLALVFLMLWLSFTEVPTGTVGIVTRFGNVNRVIPPGAHLLLPFSEEVHTLGVQTETLKPSEEAASLDLQMVHTEVTLAYHYDPNNAGWVYSQLGGNAPASVIQPAILEAIKAVTAKYNANDLIAKRAEVRDGIDDFVKQRLLPYHIVTENVSITDFHFSKDYEQAIENKVTAVQNAEKAQNDLNRIKIEAEQKVAQAQAEAAGLRAQQNVLTPELLQLRMIEMMKEKWDGHLPENYYGGNAPLPVVGALADTKKK